MSNTPEKQARLDMQQARHLSQVDVAATRDFIHGGQDRWKEYASIVSVLSKDPVFDTRDRVHLVRSERYAQALKMARRIHELQDEHGWTNAQVSKAIEVTGESSSYTLHFIAFEPVMRAQASEDLLAEYDGLIEHRGIIGCYLQTELGHGSNVNALETTATYVKETGEFEINSPTFTSRKWWIGAAGKLATHGVIQAKLILPDGRDMGPHLFLIQLRSMEDHRTLPGITLGDIGPKALGAWGTTDNGFAIFDNVRIPARFMLSKFAQVTPDGHYTRPPHAKISYGGMVYIRSTLVTSIGWWIARASTIAIRYCTVRRQGNKSSSGLEHQIINYPAVYNRLLPILSRAYVFLLLGRNLNEAFATMSINLSKGDTTMLAEMHAATSGLKVLASTAVTQDLETARRCLGGHGFSEFAGIGRMYALSLPMATYEGDNYVLDLQVVRAAVKAFKRYASAAKPDPATLSPSSRYLRLLYPTSRDDVASGEWADPHRSVNLLELRAVHMVRDYVKNETDPDASAAQRVSRAVTEAFVAAQAATFIQDLPSHLPGKEVYVVKDLLTLYLLATVERGLVDLLTFNLLSPRNEDAPRELRKTIQHIELKLLPQAIGLTDAFGFTDWELNSALGVYDGSAYEALWERAQTEPLNCTDVVTGYQEYIKPVLERGRRLAARGGAKL